MEIKQWYCRIAPSLGGGFAGTPESAWGTSTYNQDFHINKNVCFFGLYGLSDFYTLWRHKGQKAILWAGSDIIHLKNNYWLNEIGDIRIDNKGICQWINKYCENWCENEVEEKALASIGITSKVCPSFLGNVDDYPLSYQYNEKPKFYTSVSGNDFELYKWDEVIKLSDRHPEVEFHFYGNTEKYHYLTDNNYPNTFFHGRVSQEQMDNETKGMTGAIRLLEHDGCSEIIVKGALRGHYSISTIEYPHTSKEIQNEKEPNIKGREWVLNNVNKYPWNTKI